jgi:nitroreductase
MVKVWEDIGSLARLAPTPHNTQPFRIRPLADRDRAELVLLTERLLPREDHGNLYVAASFGTFAASLERAARHFGHALAVAPVEQLDTERLETLGPEVVVGHAKLAGHVPAEPLADLLDARRTSRLPYHDRAIEPAALTSLARICSDYGHRFVHHDDPNVVRPLLKLNAEAIIDNLQLADEREEIRGWHRLGKTPEFGDGLWQEPMNQPAWELWSAFAAPSAFKLPGLKSFAVRRYLLTQRGTRHVALLCGRFKAWPELYRAGRLLLDLWLEMAHHQVYMQPMGSMLTNPHYVAEIERRFDCSDCWLVVRLGYSDVPPRAPRLERIVIS